MDTLIKISNYLNSLDSIDDLLIIWYSNSEPTIKIFNRDCDGAYMTAARYIYGIFCMWTTYDGVALTAEKLFDLCVDENSFGDILELYIMTAEGNFKRVCGEG